VFIPGIFFGGIPSFPAGNCAHILMAESAAMRPSLAARLGAAAAD